jgi:WD40 repeat protein
MLLASGTVDGAIRLWDAATGETSAFLDGHRETVAALMFTGPTQLISASWDATLRVWDLTRPGVSRVLPHDGPVRAMIVPRPGLLLSAGADAIVQAWELATYGSVRRYVGHRDAVIAVAALSHSTFVSGSTDRTVRVWATDSGINLATFTFDAPVTAVTALLGVGRLVVGDASGRVHVLQYEEGDLR